MSTLEQQCEEIRELWINGDSSTWSNGAIEILLAYIAELRGEIYANSQDDGKLEREIVRLQEQLAELRRPSDAKEIAQIQEEDRTCDPFWFDEFTKSSIDKCEAYIAGISKAIVHRRTLLHALAESQRECARLKSTVISQDEEFHALYSESIQLRTEIARLMAERDAARERCKRLERDEALLQLRIEAMEDCICEEGQVFEERAEELIVTEVQHSQCEKSLHEALAERDALEESLADAHLALGGNGEWCGKLPPEDPPNSGDLRHDVPALATQLAERVTELTIANEAMHGTMWQRIEELEAALREIANVYIDAEKLEINHRYAVECARNALSSLAIKPKEAE